MCSLIITVPYLYRYIVTTVPLDIKRIILNFLCTGTVLVIQYRYGGTYVTGTYLHTQYVPSYGAINISTNISNLINFYEIVSMNCQSLFQVPTLLYQTLVRTYLVRYLCTVLFGTVPCCLECRQFDLNFNSVRFVLISASVSCQPRLT